MTFACQFSTEAKQAASGGARKKPSTYARVKGNGAIAFMLGSEGDDSASLPKGAQNYRWACVKSGKPQCRFPFESQERV